MAISQEPPQRKQRKMTTIPTNSIQMAYGWLIPAALQKWGCCSSMSLGPDSAEAENAFLGCAHSTNCFILPSLWLTRTKVHFCCATHLMQRHTHANTCPRTPCLQWPAWTRWSKPSGRLSSPQLSYGCFKTCFPGDLLNSLILVLLKIH